MDVVVVVVVVLLPLFIFNCCKIISTGNHVQSLLNCSLYVPRQSPSAIFNVNPFTADQEILLI